MTRMHGCRSLLNSTISLVETEGGREGGGGQLFIRGHVNSNNWRILITRFSNGARRRLALLATRFLSDAADPNPLFHHVNSLGAWNREIRRNSSPFLSLRYLDNLADSKFFLRGTKEIGFFFLLSSLNELLS